MTRQLNIFHFSIRIRRISVPLFWKWISLTRAAYCQVSTRESDRLDMIIRGGQCLQIRRLVYNYLIKILWSRLYFIIKLARLGGWTIWWNPASDCVRPTADRSLQSSQDSCWIKVEHYYRNENGSRYLIWERVSDSRLVTTEWLCRM